MKAKFQHTGEEIATPVKEYNSNGENMKEIDLDGQHVDLVNRRELSNMGNFSEECDENNDNKPVPEMNELYVIDPRRISEISTRRISGTSLSDDTTNTLGNRELALENFEGLVDQEDVTNEGDLSRFAEQIVHDVLQAAIKNALSERNIDYFGRAKVVSNTGENIKFGDEKEGINSETDDISPADISSEDMLIVSRESLISSEDMLDAEDVDKSDNMKTDVSEQYFCTNPEPGVLGDSKSQTLSGGQQNMENMERFFRNNLSKESDMAVDRKHSEAQQEVFDEIFEVKKEEAVENLYNACGQVLCQAVEAEEHEEMDEVEYVPDLPTSQIPDIIESSVKNDDSDSGGEECIAMVKEILDVTSEVIEHSDIVRSYTQITIDPVDELDRQASFSYLYPLFYE